jgi:hypothetical protein
MSLAGLVFSPPAGRKDRGVRIMFKKIAISAAVAASALTVMPAAAEAQSYGYYNQGYGYNGRYVDPRYAQRYNQRYYNGYNPYNSYNGQTYYQGRYNYNYGYRCNSGSTGTIIGAIAGGLLGSQVAGRGDRAIGAIVGGAAGALAGREIDRSSGNGYNCRR